MSTGLGPMPGSDPAETAATVLGELGEAPHRPFLAQLPARGPGADPLGRASALLVDLAVDLQPSGWRFTDNVGRDQTRAQSFLRNDLDELAEAADGFVGGLTVPVLGPWSVLAGVELNRGEKSVADPGARRDVADSLAEGLTAHLADVRRLIPGAAVSVLVEEPALVAVIEGRLATASGYGSLRAVDPAEIRTRLRTVLDAILAADAVPVLRVGPDAPIALLREAGARGVAVDVARLDDAAWESVATGVEAGVQLWAGLLPVSAGPPPVAEAVDGLRVPWKRLGLAMPSIADVLVTPVGGLQTLPPAAIRPYLRRLREVQDVLPEVSAE